MKNKFFSNKKNSTEAIIFDDIEVKKAIEKKYKFEYAFQPNGYDVIFICLYDDKNDSRKDLWKAIFFKKSVKRKETITLDNKNEINNFSKTEIVFLKEIDGNYEDMINISINLIKKLIIKIENQKK